MQFDSGRHKAPNFEPLKGRYRVRVEEAMHGRNKGGTGELLTLKLVVVSPRDQGRVMYERFTTSHVESAQAVEIGLGQLSEASRALRLPAWNHERQLEGREADVEIIPDGKWQRVKTWIVPEGFGGAPASNPPRDEYRGQQGPPPAQGYGPPPGYQQAPQGPPPGYHAPPPAYGHQGQAPPAQGYQQAPPPRNFPTDDDMPF